FLDPVLLHIRLPALGTGKGPPHVMHHPLLFHNGSFTSFTPFRGWGACSRFTERALLLKLGHAQFERLVCLFLVHDFLPRPSPEIVVLDILRHFRAAIPM